MASSNRIIIDTDPGVDDILALLLAFSANPEELEVLLISLTFGNVDVQNCLRNAVSLFHHIEKEQEWRGKNGKPEGFETLRSTKPIVAVGAEEPLADQLMMADYFHGVDGLGGIHSSHPHLTPAESWKSLFDIAVSSGDDDEAEAAREIQASKAPFTPSQLPAHEEMLRLLRENEPDTITIIAIGPMTNLALAAAADPETFLRAKEVVVMGGAIEHTGNMTPVAEFNTYADSIAAARVYALTSPNPKTTMPPVPPAPPGKQSTEPPPPFLKAYPEKLSRRLKVKLFPLDITERHVLTRGTFNSIVGPQLSAGSPLAEWMTAFLGSTFAKMESLTPGVSGDVVGLALHDPLCIWYALLPSSPQWTLSPHSPEDIRVETSGQWTRGMCVVDRRNRKKRLDDDGEGGQVPSDTGNWLGVRSGNRVDRVVGTPGEERFGGSCWGGVFG